MPQVKDLEALVCGGGGGDTKVSCETQIGKPPPPDDPDLPPESIVVRVGSGRDLLWADVGGAVFYERDDSTKGSTNPKAQAQQHQHANPTSKPRSNSQRFSGSLQPKPPIIGIPANIQHHSGYLGRSGRRPANARIFPKRTHRSGGGGGDGRKSTVPQEDPGSPKVSCIGKVLSERERHRCRRRCSRSTEEWKGEKAESAWARLSAVFCCGGGERLEGTASAETVQGDWAAKATVEWRAAAKPAVDPPGLGATKRFASGRRPASWGGDADVGVDLGSLNREAADWARRRSVGSLEDAERELESNASASV